MRTALILLTALGATAAVAQTAPSLTPSLLPGYLGASTPITGDAPSLSIKARSVRVNGSWQVCNAANYAGTCQTLTADQPLFNFTIRSARPTASITNTTAGTSTSANTTTAASTSAAINLDTLDVANGANGQDVEFYATPAFGTDQVSAGTNDKAAADAFCKRAGASSSVYASRGRVQASGLIDLTTSTKVRAFALRDVLCRR